MVVDSIGGHLPRRISMYRISVTAAAAAPGLKCVESPQLSSLTANGINWRALRSSKNSSCLFRNVCRTPDRIDLMTLSQNATPQHVTTRPASRSRFRHFACRTQLVNQPREKFSRSVVSRCRKRLAIDSHTCGDLPNTLTAACISHSVLASQGSRTSRMTTGRNGVGTQQIDGATHQSQ